MFLIWYHANQLLEIQLASNSVVSSPTPTDWRLNFSVGRSTRLDPV